MVSGQIEKLVKKAQREMPTVQDILDIAIRRQGSQKRKRKYIENNFCDCVVSLESIAFKVFQEYEEKTFRKLVELWFENNKMKIDREIEKLLKSKMMQGERLKDLLQEIVTDIFPYLQYLEKSTGNMRKARGGRTFELIIKHLLEEIRVSCEKPSTKEDRRRFKNVDLLVPDIETARSKPDQAIFISAKRTLRERWKQSVPEMQLGYVYLLTIDDNISASKAKDMGREHLIAYVKDELKDKDHLKNANNVRKLSNLPRDLSRFKVS